MINRLSIFDPFSLWKYVDDSTISETAEEKAELVSFGLQENKMAGCSKAGYLNPGLTQIFKLNFLTVMKKLNMFFQKYFRGQ